MNLLVTGHLYLPLRGTAVAASEIYKVMSLGENVGEVELPDAWDPSVLYRLRVVCVTWQICHEHFLL